MPDYFNRHISPEEQKLYDHLLHWVKLESPCQLIERFRNLFIEGGGYSEPQVRTLVSKIVTSEVAEQEFEFILNRCCYILINHWRMQPQCRTAIPELVALFETTPQEQVYSQPAKRLRKLGQRFTETEQYLNLRRLAQIIGEAAEGSHNSESKPLGTLINRYPYLYQHCLLSEASIAEQQQTVTQIQQQIQRQFEIELSQYMTYQIRQVQQVSSASAERSKQILPPVKNPTLLSDGELNLALKEFGGKVNGNQTHKDLAQQFLKYSMQARSYRAFKDELHGYLISSIDSDYSKRHFNRQLYTHLQNTIPQYDAQRPSESLLLRTCNKLLNFLVTESSQKPEHYVFFDLNNNIGTTSTISLLLKIVLICHQVRYHLEKRFSILFNHYELYSREGIEWLVKSLENLNVALTTNFGKVKLLV